MKKTALQWLLDSLIMSEKAPSYNEWAINKAKEMDKKEKLTRQLFIGKVVEIIGFEKTLELLKESEKTMNQ
jgi:hypothetical protein